MKRADSPLGPPARAVLILTLSAGLAACSGSGGSSSVKTGPAGQPTAGAGAVAAVKANWIKFWNGAVPIPGRLRLLQNGAQFSSFVHSQEKGSFGSLISQSSATVSAASVQSGGSANVTYTILLGGKALEKNVSGQAVYSGGQWLVSSGTFCGLLHLVYTANTKLPSVCGS